MNKKESFSKNVFLISVPLVAFDALTKWLTVKYKATEACSFWELLCFKYSENTGIAFSIPIPLVVISVMNVVLLGFILKFATQEFKVNKISTTALSLIFAGGVGNLIDRVARGFVVDFISVSKFPIFNVADIYISVGVLMVLAFYGKIKR